MKKEPAKFGGMGFALLPGLLLGMTPALSGCAEGDLQAQARVESEALCIQSPPKIRDDGHRDASAVGPAPWYLQIPLSERELALQRQLSRLTIDTRHDEDIWSEWWVNPSQTGLDAIRYPLAFAAYASFTTAARTPAYTELAAEQMRDAIERMIRSEVYAYIERYWADEPTYPDPVWVENVMYSGHLLQMMVMYQAMTGDDRYATEGWDFVWKDGSIIHYDLHKLAHRLHEMMLEHHTGGLPCEPDLIFVYCNNHSALALAVYDDLYPSGFGPALDKWRDYMQQKAPFRVEAAPSFFKIIYYGEAHAWIPYGEAGGDAWGLMWMVPWNGDQAFLDEGWNHLLQNRRFIEHPDGRIHIDASMIMHEMDVSDATASSFLPMLARQMEGSESPTAEASFQWFEEYETWVDHDGDGVEEALYYQSDDIDRNVLTTNLLLGYSTLSAEALKQHLYEPEASFGRGARLWDVDRDVANIALAYGTEGGGIRLEISPLGRGVEATTFKISDFEGGLTLYRDGVPWAASSLEGADLLVTTDLFEAHVFELR